MKRALSVLLLLRYPTSSSTDLISALERGLDCADAAGDIPIHWCYPVHPLFGDSSSRADRIVARLKARPNDRMLPVGFAGAYHPLLQVDELRKEIAWTASNPWKEDLKTAFGTDTPTAIFPLSVDLSRAKSRSIYTGAPRLLALDHTQGRLVAVDGEGFTSIPLLTSGRHDTRRLARELLRYYRRDTHDSVGIVVDGLGAASEELAEVFETLEGLRARRSGFVVHRIDASPGRPDTKSDDVSSLALRVSHVPSDPLSRALRSAAQAKPRGRKRGTDELIKRRLERLAFVDPNETRTDQVPKPQVDERTLVADMSGVVNLTESQLSVRFDRGRLAGMAHGRTKVVVEQPIRSYVRIAGVSREFTTVSTFSFEGERCRGLRTILVIDGDGIGQPGQIIGDYYFEDGQSDLLAAITVTYPELTGSEQVEEYALLEIPLFRLRPGEEVEAECEYPDGERYTTRLEAQPFPFQLAGQRFCFRSGSGEFRLAFPELPNAIPEVLGVRFRSDRNGSTLCISPRGSYSPSPAAAFTEVVEQFRLSASVAPSRPPEKGAPGGKAVPTSG